MLDQKETLSEKFVKKGFWLYLFTFFIGPLGYLIKVLISRDLSIGEVGIIYGVISFVTLLSTYNDLGFTESMSYYLPKFIVSKDYARAKYVLRLVMYSQIISSTLIYLTIFVFASWLSKYYFKSDIDDILRVAGLFFIGANIMHLAKAIFSAAQDTKLQNGSEFVRILATAIGVSILFQSESGTTYQYMIMWISGLGVGVLFSVFWALKKYYFPYFHQVKTHVDTKLRKEFFLYSLSSLLASNIGMMLSQIDMQLIIYYLTPTDVGYYSTYLSIIGIPFLFFAPIISFLFPVISELSGRGDEAKIEMLAKKFWWYFAIITVWISHFLFFFGGHITTFLFSEKFAFSGEILQYSVPFLLFNVLGQISFQVLSGRGLIKKRMKVLFITLIINIILNIILIQLMGVVGSALAVGISWIPLFILAKRETKIRFHIESYRTLIENSVVLIVLSFIIFSIRQAIHIPLLGEILLAILLYVSIFLLVNARLLRESIDMIRRSKAKNI